MSRIIAACIMTVLVAVSCISGQITVNNCDNKISTLIDQACDAAKNGDFSAAEEAAEKAEEAFVECEPKLGLFINHRLVEELGMELSKLPSLANENAGEEFLAELESARVMMIHIVRDNHPTILNIL